ncbi:hypothetical protein MY04_4781 [Flammeovirga sp. MY04]|uniref:hypothetical protein n=1 Tax=Flammeovirga sp. MY04 TaxID=1191459 RepID=UPI0008060FED|nr:hypothetical protein [Flammeovirga sp. MY04]ANQ49598.1 hypothetical protein MY04_2224 [Flammeovirga sp. MY04]ANQ52116.1 hypothetical protein MY04_4781 [Flammeovirga sp. MY04]
MNIKTLRVLLINQLVDAWREQTPPQDYLKMRKEMVNHADTLLEGFNENGFLEFGGVKYQKQNES